MFNKFINWLGKWLPKVWSLMLIILITATTMGASVWSVRWLLTILGVL